MTHLNQAAITRRQFNRQAAGATAVLAAANALGADGTAAAGAIRGEPTTEKVGLKILAAGGNAVDAAVAAALTAFARTDERVRRMLEAFQCDLPKPVEPAMLTAEIARLTGRERRRVARSN